MIIINQNRDTIINFDNVNYIKMRKLPCNEVGYAIVIDTMEAGFDRFALYDTKERAKEVLQEIIGFWENGAMQECNGFICYQMPEK